MKITHWGQETDAAQTPESRGEVTITSQVLT